MIHRWRSGRGVTVLGAAILALSFVCSPARADGSDSEHLELNRFLSGNGNVAFLAAGTLLPLLEDGDDGPKRSLHAANALASSLVVSEGLKYVFHEKRPDSGQHDSFPSGHTTAAFAVATVQSRYHPDQALYWYAGATAIGASRLSLNRHFLQDVVAGAALGYAVGSASFDHRHLHIIPEFAPDQHAIGVSLHLDF